MHNFPFSKRTDWASHSNSLNEAIEDFRRRGIPFIDLTESNPTHCGFHYPEKLLEGLNQQANLLYVPDSKGMANARKAVARHYHARDAHLSQEQIILTSSTSEAYSFLFRLLVNPGEKVLIPKPSYPLFQFLLEINDAEFDYYPLEYSNGWRINRPALEELIDSKTRAIVLVNPNNPTGSYINAEDLNFLNALCQKHQMAIISDEVFFDYSWTKEIKQSCAANSGALTFTLAGLSKTMALPQMKCAWILASGPKPILGEALTRLEIIADTYLSVNTPVQNALEGWLDATHLIQKQIMDRVSSNWRMIEQFKDKLNVLSVEGGWYCILKLPETLSEEEWVLKFLTEDRLLAHPGYFFDFDEEAYVIISLLTDPKDFQTALNKIHTRLLA